MRTASNMNHDPFKAACAEHVAPGHSESPFEFSNSMPAAGARTQSSASLDGHQDVPSSPDPVHQPLPENPLDFRIWVESCFRLLGCSRVGLSHFVALSLVPPACTSQPASSERGILWPCPPPRWRWTGSCKLSPRRRKRKRMLALSTKLLSWVVATLNWFALGCPKTPPRAACVGGPLSVEQLDMQSILSRHVCHFLGAAPLTGAALGRCEEKFAALLHAAQELPCHAMPCSDVDLDELVAALSAEFDPYTRVSGPRPRNPSDSAPSHRDSGSPPKSCHERADQALGILPPEARSRSPADAPSHNLDPPNLGHVRLGGSVQYKEVVASRIKWEQAPQFDPTPYLSDPIVRAVYRNPDSLRLPQDAWPPARAAQVHCSKGELLALATKWDQVGALQLVKCSKVDPKEAVGLFAIPKDRTWDRLIINPTVVNSRTQPYSNYTRGLAPGCLLTLVQLNNNQVLRLSADDLTEFYYTFAVTPARAARNCIRFKLLPHEVQHLSCFQPNVHDEPVFLALATLAMGDCCAVEIAQQSHHNVLRFLGGSMRADETVAYRKPFPRGDTAELLAVDDHVVAQKITRAEFYSRARARDTEIFEQAEKAYCDVQLVQHEKKRKRNLLQGVFLGAEVDGDVGFVGAPRHRTGVLMYLTCQLVFRGTSTAALLASIIGLWVHVLMFRRPALCILSAAFADAGHQPRDAVFALSRQTLNELAALVVLGPVLQSDLRIEYTPFLYAMDASPGGAGICRAPVAQHVIAELWRHTEQKGYYSKLESPAAALLREQGLEPAVPSEMPKPGFCAETLFPRPLQEGILFDVLEVFSGSKVWTRAHVQLGSSAHPGVDTAAPPPFGADLRDKRVFQELLALVLRRVVGEFHFGPPCRTFGSLRRPRLRSKDRPAGFSCSEPLTAEHNTLARRTAFLCSLILHSGGFFSVEQPGSSVMFYLHCFRVLIWAGAVVTRFCCCSFGSPFMKPMQWLHNKPWLLKLAGQCSCPHKGQHLLVQGSFSPSFLSVFRSRCRPSVAAVFGVEPKLGASVASFSGTYPLPLVQQMAAGSLQAKRGAIEIIPLSHKCSCLEEFGWAPPADRERTGEPLPTQRGDSGSCLVPSGSDPEDFVGPTRRAFFDDPEWVGELADSLPFEEVVRYRFKQQGHINIQEARARKTWLKHLCRYFRRSRTVGLIDSRVLLGASAKGRSSSAALCHVQRTELPFVLGGGLYTGGLHVYSSKNRADGPSRNRPPDAPTKALPTWYQALCRGDYTLFDVYVASQGVPKIASRWLRLLLLLGGDIERNPGPATGVFGATGRRSSRLPNQSRPQVPLQPARAAAVSGSECSESPAARAPDAPGRSASLPPRRRAPAPVRAARGPLDLQSGFAASTRQKMTKSLEAFRCWLLDEFGLSLPQVLSSQRSAALALRAYGLALFEGGFPRYLLVYAITAVQDLCPEFRSHLTPAWQIDKKWQLAEPGSCRPVISRPVLLAALSVALLWGWADWAAITLLGFLCMLHPNEFIVLTRGDLVLPVDALSADRIAYIHIGNPKTARFARRQHCRLEDDVALRFLEARYTSRPFTERIFRGSLHTYRQQWNSIMAKLGVPFRQADRGATPGVLRGSGATFLYAETEDLALVAWRGRWSKIKTIEFYLQEVAAQLLLQQLGPTARERIRSFSSFTRALLEHAISVSAPRNRASP